MQSDTSTTTLPALPELSLEDLSELDAPSQRIRSNDDVTWKSTRGYHNYMTFLHRLSESVVGHDLPQTEGPGDLCAEVTSMLSLLDKLDSWIDEIPPLPTPQRFGNLAFRIWGERLEDNAEDVMKTFLPVRFHDCIRLLKPYFVISFGSFLRMDYGTGHEAAFGILLLCLTLVRFFQPEPEEERNLALVVFTRYLRLCWKLQDVYNLEPAGSHGVWGLDDYSFLGYIFGSGQLKGRRDVPVASVLQPPLPLTNLYNLSISRIHEVKHGPFHEHSSQLYAIATGVPNWGKVNSGLFKMYEAEVLGKWVVVQHIPVGGFLEWNIEGSSGHPLGNLGFDAGDTKSRELPIPRSETGIKPAFSPALTGGGGARWAGASISSRLVVRTSLLPSPSAMLSGPFPASMASTTLPTGAPAPSLSPANSTSLHSSAQRVESHAFTVGSRKSGEEQLDRVTDTRNV